MRVTRGVGRTVADTAVLAALTGRPPAAVRRWCDRDDDGYDVGPALIQLDGKPDPEVIAGSRAAAEAFGIPEGTIRSWVSRGRLRPLGYDEHGWTLFDVEDLRRLAQQAR